MPDEDPDGDRAADPGSPDRAIPPASGAIADALAEDGGRLLHCLDCGRQLVALRHGGSCLFCGSAAVVIEATD